jgi:Mg-chelatase subunit ChlD
LLATGAVGLAASSDREDAVAAMTRQLRPEDRFGMVVFNDRAAVAKPVRPVAHTDMEAIRGHIRELEADGGTDISAGIETATDILSEYDDQDRTRRETRTILGTDAMSGVEFAYTEEGRPEEAAIADSGVGVYLTMSGSTARDHGLELGERLFPSETVLMENAAETNGAAQTVIELFETADLNSELTVQ